MTKSVLRSCLYVTVAISVMGLCYGITRWLTQTYIVFAQRNVAPYLVEMQIYSFDATTGPQGKHIANIIKARRSSGVEAYAASRDVLGFNNYARRVDFPDGLRIGLVEMLRKKSTMRLRNEEVVEKNRILTTFDATKGCVARAGEVLRGTDEINGITAEMIEGIDQRSLRWTRWRVPSLHCLEVQYQVEKLNAESYHLITKGVCIRLETVEPGESAQWLFAVAGDYIEASPSEIEQGLMVAAGFSPEDCKKCKGSENVDKQYREQHSGALREKR